MRCVDGLKCQGEVLTERCQNHFWCVLCSGKDAESGMLVLHGVKPADVLAADASWRVNASGCFPAAKRARTGVDKDLVIKLVVF